MNAAAKENEQLLNEILILVNRLKIRNLLYTEEVKPYEQTKNANSFAEILGETQAEKA